MRIASGANSYQGGATLGDYMACGMGSSVNLSWMTSQLALIMLSPPDAKSMEVTSHLWILVTNA